MSELLPCPFCGGEAIVTHIEAHDHTPALKLVIPGIEPAEDTYWPECPTCGGAKSGSHSQEHAVKAWNTRVGVAPAASIPCADCSNETACINRASCHADSVRSSFKGKREHIPFPPARSAASSAEPFDLKAFQQEAEGWEDVETEQQVHHINGPFASPIPVRVMAEGLGERLATPAAPVAGSDHSPDVGNMVAGSEILREALTGLIEAVRRDSDEGGKGISGYTSARLSDARAAIASAAVGGWQDISTAPKDGLYLIRNDLDEVCPLQSRDGHRVIQNMVGYADWTFGSKATGWMPLPLPRHDRSTSQPDTGEAQ